MPVSQMTGSPAGCGWEGYQAPQGTAAPQGAMEEMGAMAATEKMAKPVNQEPRESWVLKVTRARRGLGVTQASPGREALRARASRPSARPSVWVSPAVRPTPMCPSPSTSNSTTSSATTTLPVANSAASTRASTSSPTTSPSTPRTPGSACTKTTGHSCSPLTSSRRTTWTRPQARSCCTWRMATRSGCRYTGRRCTARSMPTTPTTPLSLASSCTPMARPAARGAECVGAWCPWVSVMVTLCQIVLSHNRATSVLRNNRNRSHF